MRVMIVDEDRELSDLLKKTLWMSFYSKAKDWAKEGGEVREGLEIEQFGNYVQALKHLGNHPEFVDVIFTACPARELDAGAFIQTCRRKYRQQYRSLVVVMDRGRQQPEQAQEELEGVEGFLWQPFGPEDLMQHMPFGA